VTNAALIAEVVDRAHTSLTRTGHQQVQVTRADGEHGYPTHGPYDAIIVTVEAADIPPAWTDQLAPDGVLVVPLRMRGNTRSLAPTRQDDHLATRKLPRSCRASR
jgi:protein-L-isoaspartate(D-aspartate) O-methyltransferase